MQYANCFQQMDWKVITSLLVGYSAILNYEHDFELVRSKKEQTSIICSICVLSNMMANGTSLVLGTICKTVIYFNKGSI